MTMSLSPALAALLFSLLAEGLLGAGTVHDVPTSEATIAFHITITAPQLPLLRRFLTRIYHSGNLYLLDFAPPLSPHLYSSSPNVHHRAADPYVENGVSEVINVLDGMAYFLDREVALGPGKAFDYYVHCTPADYPTVSPVRMRQLLGFAASRPSPPNFFHYAHESQLPLFRTEVDKVYYDFSLTFNRSLPLDGGLVTNGLYHPDHSRRRQALRRAEKHFVVNRAYVKLAVDSIISKRLLMSLGDASHVFENFFGSLAVNAGSDVGELVRSTSLRCTNSNALDAKVSQVLPPYTPRSPGVDFLRGTQEPCLFTGPFSAELASSLTVRDSIDSELLIAPGTQGKPSGRGYHLTVYENLRRVLNAR